MHYRVVITPEAQASIDRDIEFIRLHASPDTAERWFAGLIEAIRSLSTMPKRCGLIPENWLFDEELRHPRCGRLLGRV